MTAQLLPSAWKTPVHPTDRDARQQIQLLSDDLASLYRSTRRERQILHRLTWKKRSYFLDQIEDFTDDVQGYAAWIGSRGRHRHPEEARNHLAGLHPLKLLLLTHDYPNLRRYVAFHDYLRHLLIDYLGEFL